MPIRVAYPGLMDVDAENERRLEAFIEEQRREAAMEPDIDQEIEEGLRAQAEYGAMEREQERDYRQDFGEDSEELDYQHAQEYDALRAEEAEREAEAELELEQDFEYSIEQTIRAEIEGDDAAMSAAESWLIIASSEVICFGSSTCCTSRIIKSRKSCSEMPM